MLWWKVGQFFTSVTNFLAKTFSKRSISSHWLWPNVRLIWVGQAGPAQIVLPLSSCSHGRHGVVLIVLADGRHSRLGWNVVLVVVSQISSVAIALQETWKFFKKSLEMRIQQNSEMTLSIRYIKCNSNSLCSHYHAWYTHRNPPTKLCWRIVFLDKNLSLASLFYLVVILVK